MAPSVAAGTARHPRPSRVRGRLIALDQDRAAHAARAIDDPRFSFVHARFSTLAQVLAAAASRRCDGVLLDLGVSSPQLDDAGARLLVSRRRAARHAHGHDARRDRRGVARPRQTEQEIREVIRDYGEERFAKQIAAAIVAARRREPIVRTRQLAEVVARAVRTREPGQDPATRTFQALRIHVNQELEELALMLPQAAALLAPGGRLAVISFHSLEDRIVKRFMRAARARTCPAACRCAPATCRSRRSALVGKAQRASGAQRSRAIRARAAPCCGWRSAPRSPDRTITESSPTRGGETEPPPPRRPRRLRARARHLAAPGAQALLELEREQDRARELDVECGQLQLEPSTWALHCARREDRHRARSACARPTRAACAIGAARRSRAVSAARAQGLVRLPVLALALRAAAVLLAGFARARRRARSTCRR